MGSLVLAGATSGSTTITPTDAVTATVTLPSTGGTLQTSGAGFTTNGVAYATSTSALATGSALQFDGANLLVNSTTVFDPNGYASGGAKFIQAKATATDRGSFLNLLGGGGGASGYWIGGINFAISGQTNPAATIFSYTGSTTTSGILSFSTSSNTTAAPTERMRLDSSGNLLLGTTVANYSLNVKGAGSSGNSSVYAQFTTTDTGTTSTDGLLVGVGVGSSPTAYILQFENAPIVFSTNGTERMRIDSSGKVGIGTSSPSYKLDVVGTNCIYTETSVATGTCYQGVYANTTGLVYFGSWSYNSIGVGTITSSGSGTAYNTTSDYRLKNTIAPMTGALAKVALLKPVTYKWNVDGSDSQGFIAHELQEIVPECVHGSKDGTREEEYEVTPAVKDEEGNITTPAVMGTRTVPVYQGIDTSFLVATLTSAIQEMHTLITAQSATITSLTERITALEGK
jgi:hypothetical protein